MADARDRRDAARQRRDKDLLRFLTCGSVDDGKSTLIGRLLYDTKLILETSSRRWSATVAKHGTTGDEIDFALLVDGLEAEREQGITIDVAYRYFATPRRTFIVADTPGPRAVHPQHGDRRLDRRSRGHAGRCAQGRAGADPAARFICSLLGIRHVVLAVNKIDLVGFDARRLRPHRRAITRPSPRGLGFALDRADPDLGALRRQCHRALGAACPGTRARRCSSISRRVDVDERPRRPAVPLSGAMGQPAEPRFPRLCRHGRVGLASRRATRSWSRASGQRVAGQARSSPIDGDLPRADGRRGGHADARQTRSTSRAATCWSPPERAGRGRRPVRRASRLDGRGAAAARPLLSAAASAPAPCRRTRHRRSSTSIDVNTLRASRRDARSALNEIGFCNLVDQRAGRLRSLCARTATPAPSS